MALLLSAEPEEPVEETKVDLEMEFQLSMMPVLADCSRQKLRSFQMVLLKYGANVNERVNPKDISTAFQVKTACYCTCKNSVLPAK